MVRKCFPKCQTSLILRPLNQSTEISVQSKTSITNCFHDLAFMQNSVSTHFSTTFTRLRTWFVSVAVIEFNISLFILHLAQKLHPPHQRQENTTQSNRQMCSRLVTMWQPLHILTLRPTPRRTSQSPHHVVTSMIKNALSSHLSHLMYHGAALENTAGLNQSSSQT